MFKNRHFNEERRSKLFSEMPFMWGRLPKFLVAWIIMMQFNAGYYLWHRHSMVQHLQDETRKAYRRSLPFTQAMEDVRYLAITRRNLMIMKAVCDQSQPEMFDLFRARYNQEDFFLSYTRGSTMKNFYDGRYGSENMIHLKTARVPEDERGLVGFQDVSTYG